MSDDEYIYEEYGEDFEDYLWDADPAPDLADDLAEHAAYSPVWQDNPHGELEQYHSDWEYYSDDFYDDLDPAAQKDEIVDGSSAIGKTGKLQTQKRSRKRKLDEARETPTFEGKNIFLSSLQGVVWANNRKVEAPVFRQGQQERVALLTDWRSLFKAEDGRPRTFGRGQLFRDESWANDMSLADMGLQRERTSSMHQAASTSEYDGDEDIDEDEVLDDGQEFDDQDHARDQDTGTQLLRVGSPKVVERQGTTPKKRRKTVDAPSPSNQQNMISSPILREHAIEQEALSAQELPSSTVEEAKVQPSTHKGRSSVSMTKSRKRQKPLDFDEGADEAATVSGNAAKRVASSKLTAGRSEIKKTTSSSPSTRRSTRNRTTRTGT